MGSSQRLDQVCIQIVPVLNGDREPYQAVADAEILSFLFWKNAVRAGRRV
jgi:hypothetical protein